jgi:hypothetical protein
VGKKPKLVLRFGFDIDLGFLAGGSGKFLANVRLLA